MTVLPSSWPGPADVDESSLQLGKELGRGGQGRVLRVLGQQIPLVFKQYTVAGADQIALKILVDMPQQLQPSEQERLHRLTAWPLACVFHQGRLSGFLMQEIPGHFFAENSVGTTKARELQYLLFERKPMWGDIVPDGGVSVQTRIEVASEFTKLVAVLHGKALVIGDVSMSNVLWAGADGETSMIFVIDCDGIRRLGSYPVLPQADTPDWNDPRQPPSGPDLDTDRYKLALLVGRVLCSAPYLRPGEPLTLVPGIPDRMAARIENLWKQAAGPHGSRPDAIQWNTVLSDRDEIPLAPPPPVRQRPQIPLGELEQPGMARPVIQLPPRGIRGPSGKLPGS